MRNAVMTTAGVLAFVIASLPAAADTVRFAAALGPDPSASTQPAQPSTGAGNATLSLDTASKTVSWTIEYTGLPQPPRQVGCGAIESTSPPPILLSSNLASPIHGSKTLTDGDIAALKAGSWVCVVGGEGEAGDIGGVLQPAP